MKLEDARKLDQDSQEALRKRAVKAVVDGKKPHQEIANLLGIARGTVSRWVSTFKKQGEQSLEKKKRGRKSSDMKLLKPHQCATIVRLITDRCPSQFKFPFMLWTREAVGELIHQRYDLKLSIRTVGNYLKRWGFTPQKPVKRAYERQESKVKEWLNTEYPAIAKQAKQEKAEIHWGDEAGFRSDHQTGTTYGLKGKTPVILSTGKRFRTNMISTVTNNGKLRFMLFDESFTQQVFMTFLKRLIYKAPTKIYLIVDNHRVHHGKLVRAWLEEHKKQIEIFYLPAYSPDLNPDELLNHDVKSNAVGRKRAHNLQELKNNLLSYLLGTQRCPEIVRAFFQKNEVLYAA